MAHVLALAPTVFCCSLLSHRSSSIHEPWFITTNDLAAWSAPRPLLLPFQDAGRSVIDLFPLFSFSPPPVGDSDAAAEAGAAAPLHTLFYKMEDNGCESHEYEIGSRVSGYSYIRFTRDICMCVYVCVNI